MDTHYLDDTGHVNYPHYAGRLHDCPACEGKCHCKPGETRCIFDGPHALLDPMHAPQHEFWITHLREKFTIHKRDGSRLNGVWTIVDTARNGNLVMEENEHNTTVHAAPDELRPYLTRTCRHCRQTIDPEGDFWIDTEATGDDIMWREYCPQNDTERAAPHEPEE